MKNWNDLKYNNYNKRLYKGGDEEDDDLQIRPLEVRVYNNFDKALKAFRAMVQKERILSIYKEKQTYEKPSDKRRRKRNEAKRKLLEAEFLKTNDRRKKKKEKTENNNTENNNTENNS